jgi:AcrR family transcriptional regulator
MRTPAPRTSPTRAGAETRERLLAAAAKVFVEHGYRGATMREIADGARANLAAAHYHFGSKEELYLEVARRQYGEIEERLGAEESAAAGQAGADASRAEIERRLEARVHAMLELLLETHVDYGRLMLREFCDPSDALPEIVKRFVEPLRRGMDSLVERLEPGLASDAVERCSRSIVGQIFFYLTHRPALLLMMGRESYAPGFSRTLAEHITRFSLGGLRAVATAANGSARAPGRIPRKAIS